MIKFKNDKGVTIVALVITAIVLMILAGVTVVSLTSGDSIIFNTKKAAQDYGEKEQQQQDVLSDIDKEREEYNNGNSGSTGPGSVTTVPNGQNWDLTKVTPIIDSSNNVIPVPKGFYYVSGSKDVGVVISDNISDRNKDDSHETAQYLEGNQFVWVPVNSMSDIYDQNNNKAQLYTFGANGISTKATYSSTGDKREPGVVTYGTQDSQINNLKEAGSSATTSAAFLTEIENEFDKIRNSVVKYGGFYIGRYETGSLSGNKVVVKAGNTDINKQNWYTMYRKQKELYKENKSVESGMIWGFQWDAALRWMQKNSALHTYVGGTTDKANFINTTFDYYLPSKITTTKPVNFENTIPSGSANATKVNNIYDMAGNVWEWTMECYNTHYRNLRRRYVYAK